MPALTVDRLTKSYGTRAVFDGVSFSVEEGEKVGFIGANGSGKTTLFRIVAGEEGYESGVLAYRRDLTVGYLAQEPELPDDDTILAAVAAARPDLLDAIAEYHAVTRALATAAAESAEAEAEPAAEPAAEPEAGAEPPGSSGMPESTGSAPTTTPADSPAESGSTGTPISPMSRMSQLLARQAAAMERIEALGGWDYEHRLEAVLTRLGVEGWERRVGVLSGGERKRVALARVLVQRPDLLLLDEPTNHLDADTTEWLEAELVDYPGAVLLITHDRYFLDRVVDRMIEVNRSELVATPGGFAEYLEAKAEREARQATEEAKRSKLIAQELAWVKRAPKARTGKQKARIQRLAAARREQAAERRPDGDVVELKFGRPPRLGRTVLDIDGLGKSYDGRPLIRDFSTRLRAGERVGIVGPNGAGKTTLLRIITGEASPDTGEVRAGVNTRIAYYDQERAELDPDADLIQTVSGGNDWVVADGQRVHVRSYLNRFLFPNEVHEQKVGSLSGGERNRLLLARLLLQDANLLLLDEPTNDLDIFTLQVLESALVDFPGCVLVVTHDRYFLDKVATALLAFEGDGRVHRHEGGYDAYRRRQEAAEREAARREAERAAAVRERAERAAEARRRTAGGGAAGAGGAGAAAGPRRLTYRERQELEAMEAAITEAEAERSRLEAALADPALYTDAPETVAGLTAEFEAARRRVDELYARWEELEARGD